MNSVLQLPSVAPLILDHAVLQQARALAAQSQRSLIAELEALTGADPRSLVQAIAAPFGLTVVGTADMLEQAPAFDLLPLSKAMQRHCALLRTIAGDLIGIVADPFDADLQTWLAGASQDRTRIPAGPAIGHPGLSEKQEESVRATDNLVQSTSEGRRDGKTAAILSFASVSEAASPAVKLVNSTLYDALKAGASDIHLESTANGLAVKYRVDGVLDHAPRSTASRLPNK